MADASRACGGAYRGRTVLVIGHTGFKGSWLSTWYGFQALGQSAALVASCTDRPYDPDDAARLDPFAPRMPRLWSPG